MDQDQLTPSELKKLNNYISEAFQKDKNGNKMILANKGYSTNDDFYEAIGSFHCFKTCDSWVNQAYKESGMKACLWTPFDFGLLNKYRN